MNSDHARFSPLAPEPESRRMTVRLSVLGAGYLGITHAACMAHLGHEVLVVDTDPSRVRQLNTGYLPVHEPGLTEFLRDGLSSGRLVFKIGRASCRARG